MRWPSVVPVAAGTGAYARDRTGLRRRALGIFLALLLEAMLLLILLTLGRSGFTSQERGAVVVSFDAADAPEAQAAADSDERDAQEADRPTPQPSERAAQPPVETDQAPPPTPLKPAPTSPPIIQLSREEMASADIAAAPARPAPTKKGLMGPPDTGASGDTARVSGAGPNGEPLYAAAWYREPYDDELSGYLSTAQGPGWGLIACRTAPDYRVEDCVMLDEQPSGSRIARAVLAAAWQFRVRPPRIGGQPKIGEWVRIRIDYGLQRR